MSFNSLFSQGNQKQVIGVCLTPGIGLEAAIIDKSRQQIVNYGRREVAYSFANRDIQDMSQFKTELASLMRELNAAPKTPVYFVLPNVLFDFIEYPPDLDSESLKTMVLSNAEEFYLFKNNQPISGWCEVKNKLDANQKKIVYTSFQPGVVELIKETINNELGLKLIGIESAYSATLRGLSAIGSLDDVMLEEAPWTLMLINTNSYILFQMEGGDLISYNEVPLALKSFSMEEAYQAIVSSSAQLLANYPSSKLFIVSQTDDISADVLKRELRFDKDIIAINSNKYSKDSILPVAMTQDFDVAKSLTLGVIGASCPKCDFKLVLNVMQDDPDIMSGVYQITINGVKHDIQGSDIDKIMVAIIVILVLLFGSLFGVLTVLKKQDEEKLGEINQEIAKTDELISAHSKEEQEAKPVEVDITSIIDEIANKNVSAINFYDSISSDIPKNIWLTKYYNVDGDRIVIKGIAENVVDVYEYFKNLKILSPQSDIKLAELNVVTSSEENENFFKDLNTNIDKDSARFYSFEISNTGIGFSEAPDDYMKNENNLLGGPPPSSNIEEPSDQMKAAN